MTAYFESLGSSWSPILGAELQKPYMRSLNQFLLQEQAQGKVIYPAREQIFNALNSTPFGKVKVVILGQDPYHGPHQAHGLSFSVPQGVKIPPSLRNIFKEITADTGIPVPSHGCLQSWADQGVLLLNATLTVEQGKAGSHQGKGWETFTDKIVELLNERREGLVFMLWGSYAHKKGGIIDRSRHCVLESVHPSPLSAHRGFLGCGHFSRANEYLLGQGKSPIDWALPDAELSGAGQFTLSF
ncbi:uracil-DNA glycosylase [Aestuariicella hydrocarbonica]|uniref:Uracil-DNA glycosylase n=1 Tax=Pseudomaricurvus hydrocarbonicus TaxID=1470433 RepID=A0A9E5MJS1_9GAMM|nr:uracil-DNA glycosylase [Aestuariicella hydrocarbonica]NHO65559.1 uracil-DNA glycosylase [Aestuariicella hydrocarbonica]